MKVIALGSQGWIPARGQHTSSFIVLTDDVFILLDAGTGLCRLDEYKTLLNKYNEIHIILSHYHLDHLIGITYLLPFISEKTVVFYGPGKPYYDSGVKDYLEAFTIPAFFSRNIHNFSKNVLFVNYDTKGFFIKNTHIGISEQIHSSPSFGVTIDGAFHYATDTTLTPHIEEVAGTFKLLLHECWDLESQIKRTHTHFNDLKSLSLNHPDLSIGMIHKNPMWTDADYVYINKHTSQNLFLVKDGDEINL